MSLLARTYVSLLRRVQASPPAARQSWVTIKVPHLCATVPPTTSILPMGAHRHFCDFSVTFVDGEKIVDVLAKNDQTILEVAHANGVDIEGACGGECACSTCHVILTEEGFEQLPEMDEDEEDMLDMVQNITETSRLGCCVKLQKGRDDNLRIELPSERRGHNLLQMNA
mmetsp:Transcript_96290/g.170255  ORF Transcript_96290/g.170255 Transcript_96290/m.170255 type:complete len:169 (+) Transcript_96290:70-576(+)